METKVEIPTDMYIRQRDLVSPAIYDMRVAVAGCGATGHQVARMLTFMGVNNTLVADPDKVEEHNCPVQGFQSEDVGLPKVDGLMEGLGRNLYAPMAIEGTFESIPAGAWDEIGGLPQAVFMCTDTMASRVAIWEWCKKNDVMIALDSRVLGNAIQIYTIPLRKEKAVKVFEESLQRYDDKTAEAGRCTARMTLYGAYMASALLVRGLVNWLNAETAGLPLQVLTEVNLLVMDVSNPIEIEG